MNHPKTDPIIRKFVQRAFWMNDPNSDIFKTYFFEMITEIRQVSGRDFNADFSVDDVRRTLIHLTETYPMIKSLSPDLVVRTMNTLQPMGKVSDIFSISLAVSATFMPIGLALTGPISYLFFKTIAPGRMKCAVMMFLGGKIAEELYDTQPSAGLPKKFRTGMVPSIFLPASLIVLAVVGMVFYLFIARGTPWEFWLKAGILTDIVMINVVFALILWNQNKIKNRKNSKNNRFFEFRVESEFEHQPAYYLNREEVRFLFSLKHYFISSDIEETLSTEIKSKKRIWLNQWKNSVEEEYGFNIVTDKAVVDATAVGIHDMLPEEKLDAMILEAAVFQPYQTVNHDMKNSIPVKERSLQVKMIQRMADEMKLNLQIKNVQDQYKKALQRMNQPNQINQLLKLFISRKKSNEGLPWMMHNDTQNLQPSDSLILHRNNQEKTETDNQYFIAGAVLFDKEMRGTVLKRAESNSVFIKDQIAKIETYITIIMKKKENRLITLNYIISELKILRDMFIDSYEKTQLENHRVSVHYLEMAVQRYEMILEKWKRLQIK